MIAGNVAMARPVAVWPVLTAGGIGGLINWICLTLEVRPDRKLPDFRDLVALSVTGCRFRRHVSVA